MVFNKNKESNYYVNYYLDKKNASEELQSKVFNLNKKQLDLYEKLLFCCNACKEAHINVYYLYDVLCKINLNAISKLNTENNVQLLKYAMQTNNLENALNYINYVDKSINSDKYSILFNLVVNSKSCAKIYEILEISRNKALLNHRDFNYYMNRLNTINGVMFTDVINYLKKNIDNDNVTKIFNCLVNCVNPIILSYTLTLVNKDYLQNHEYYFYAVCAVSKMKTEETAKMSSYLLINQPLINMRYYDKVIYLLLLTDNEDIIKRICYYYRDVPKFDYHVYNEFMKEIKNDKKENVRSRIKQ